MSSKKGRKERGKSDFPVELFEGLDADLQKLDSSKREDINLKAKLEYLERRNSIIQTLLNISTSINSTLNLQELLKKVVDAVVKITDCDRGFLMLLGEDGDLSFAIARSKSQEELAEEEFQISKSIVQRVAESGEPIFLSDVQQTNNFKDRRSIQDLNINTAICLPLQYKEKLIGVIYADSDHISKNFSESDLSIMKAFGAQAVVAIENARRHGELVYSKATLENQNVSLKKKLAGRFEFSGMVGRSQAMHSIFDIIKKVAPLTTTILIQGDTGTGKELIARALHHNSPRKDNPMLSINCSALPKDLLESELFGYKKGAFTGADQDRMGLFEAADGGTLLLDEIGDMSVELQVKLLRTLQEGEVKRLGEEKPRKIDVRVISATNKNLAAEVERGNFRRDLYYRLNVVPIYIPPLRERREDILPLAEFFLEKYSLAMGVKKPGLTRAARELLLDNAWIGNVRELEHSIERALALCEGETMDVDQFEHVSSEEAGVPEPTGTTSLKERLLFQEAEYIRRMLIKHNWNVSKTAKILQISRQQLHIKIKKFGLNSEAKK
jgi:transcriptional regulator with GAF, ATPase, and Fis domain